MIVTEIISIILLAVLLFWTVYNGSIIFIGIRSKRKQLTTSLDNKNADFPKFSIIVPTKNEETVIQRCLDGIMNIDYPKEKMQIIVVDGKSDDNTLKICSEFSEKYPENVKVISEKSVKGKPAALNLALPFVTGEIVGVFDADSFPKKMFYQKLSLILMMKKSWRCKAERLQLTKKQTLSQESLRWKKKLGSKPY